MIPRATSIYIITLAVFAAGLWAIISFGSILLYAPYDLSGKWTLSDASGRDAENREELILDQSGRFVRVQCRGRYLNLKREEEHFYSSGPFERVKITIAGNDLRLTFDGPRFGNLFRIHGEGVIAGSWIAERLSPVSPRHPRNPAPAATPASQPASRLGD